jgi:hypothetical protein
VAEIHGRDAEGRHVTLDEPAVSGYLKGASKKQRSSTIQGVRIGVHDAIPGVALDRACRVSFGRSEGGL